MALRGQGWEISSMQIHRPFNSLRNWSFACARFQSGSTSVPPLHFPFKTEPQTEHVELQCEPAYHHFTGPNPKFVISRIMIGIDSSAINVCRNESVMNTPTQGVCVSVRYVQLKRRRWRVVLLTHSKMPAPNSSDRAGSNEGLGSTTFPREEITGSCRLES